MLGFRPGSWSARRASHAYDNGFGHRAVRLPHPLVIACLVGSAGLCACTVGLELAEPRFAKGDLAASSMGLVAHDPWFGSPDERARARPPNSEGLGAARSRAAVYRGGRRASEARTGGAEPQIVTLAPDLALAGASMARNVYWEQGADEGLRTDLVANGRLLLPDPYGLAREPATGPAAAGMASLVPGEVAARPPAPPKPLYPASRIWMPKLKPSDPAEA